MGKYKIPEKAVSMVKDPALRYYKSVEGITKSEFLNIVSLTGMTLRDFSLLLPVTKRTIEKAKASEKLRPDVSDRVLEIGTLYLEGIDLFGSKEAFNEWLNTYLMALGGKMPIDMLNSSNGIQMVRDVMGRIAHGVFS